MMKVDALDDLFRRQAGEQPPHGEAGGLRPQVPEGVDDAADGHAVSAQGEPAELVMLGERLREESGFGDEFVERPAHDKTAEGFDGGRLDLGAVADGKDQRAPFQPGVGAENGDGAGVVGGEVARVRSGHAEANGGVADIEDVERDDLVLHYPLP